VAALLCGKPYRRREIMVVSWVITKVMLIGILFDLTRKCRPTVGDGTDFKYKVLWLFTMIGTILLMIGLDVYTVIAVYNQM
jgi:hypothetical protein